MYATFRQYLQDFLNYARARLMRAVGLSFAGALTEGIGLLLLLPILQIVAGSSDAPFALWLQSTLVSLGLETPQTQIIAMVIGFVILIALRNLVAYRRTVLLAQISQGFIDQWRSRVFQAVARAQWQTLLGVQQHEGQHAILQDVNRLAGGTHQILYGSVAVALIAVQLAISFIVSPALTSLVLLLLATSALVLPRLAGRAQSLGQRQTLAGQKLQQNLLQFFAGLKLAKVYRAEADHVARFDGNVAAVRHEVLQFGADQAKAQALFQIASAVMLSATVLLGLFVLGTEPVTLIAVVVIMARISGPIFGLFKGVQHIANMLPAYSALKALLARLEAHPEPEYKLGQKPMGPLSITFQDVSFTYAGAQAPQVVDLQIAVEAGQMVALLGPSGVGKSTVLDMMTGLLMPSAGTVQIAGLPTHDADARVQIAQSIAYVPQDAFLIDLPLREAIAANTADVSEEAVQRALQMTGADKVVARLLEGLNTFAGERGQRLSGGERQRFGLAGAILRAPGLLILDEATSALDRASELQILHALRRLRPQMTIVVVTHRAVDPALFDQIISLPPNASR